MSTLYTYVLQFWQAWFPADIAPDLMQLLSIVTVLAMVWGCILRPILRLFRGRNK